MMPTTCDGKSCENGNRKPVTLVKTVLARKSAVQTRSRLPASMPQRTTTPANIPIRLKTTCSVVKADSDTPKICIAPRLLVPSAPRAEPDTDGGQSAQRHAADRLGPDRLGPDRLGPDRFGVEPWG